MRLTESELRQAIAEAVSAAKAPAGALTARELAEATGLDIKRVRAELGRLAAEGLIEVHWAQRPAVDTTLRWSPVYLLKKAPRPKRRRAK